MRLSFWSQSLEEEGDSILVDEGEELSPDDLDRAGEVVERIRLVREEGTPLTTVDTEVQGWRHGREFVLRFICVETDFKGRDAPLMAHGAIASQDSGWTQSVVDQIDGFLVRAQRSISSSARSSLIAVLEQIEKKQPRSRLGESLEHMSTGKKVAALVGAALTVSLAVLFLLARSC